MCILIYARGSARRKVLLLIYTFSPPVFFGVCSFEFALLRVSHSLSLSHPPTHLIYTYMLAHMSQPSASFQNPSPCHPNSLSVSHYAFYRETYNSAAVCSLFNNLLSSCCSSLRETLCATRADAKGGGGAGSASSSNHIILKHLKYLRRLASSSCYYIFLINYALNIPTTARALSRALIFEAAAIIVSQTAHSPPFLRRSSIFLVQIILCARESRRAGGWASERERCW